MILSEPKSDPNPSAWPYLNLRRQADRPDLVIADRAVLYHFHQLDTVAVHGHPRFLQLLRAFTGHQAFTVLDISLSRQRGHTWEGAGGAQGQRGD